MPNMQGLCPYNYLKDHMKAMLYWQMCGFIFKFELSESIPKTIVKAFISYIFIVISL